MKFSLLQLLKKTKSASLEIASVTDDKKKKVCADVIRNLKKNKKAIFEANKKDIALSKKNGENAAFIDRLTISENSFENMIVQVKNIKNQKDFTGELIEEKTIANGVKLQKIRVPLGVIGIIYESRPNVTVDVAALCIKSGNAVVLRGGSDAYNTNKILVMCIQRALIKNKLNADIVGFITDTNRGVVTKMLQQERYIDVIIPRGGYDLVKKVVQESKIPVLYHASGGARMYIDKSADINLAIKVCVNAKISRPATCNSLDTILVHRDIAKEFLQQFVKSLQGKAEIRADERSRKYISAKKATQKDYETEFLDYILSVKVVHDENEALSFIQKYSNKHSEGIISTNRKVIDAFVKTIDAAALFINCSTRLHDGGIFDLGAEMGIATGKLHARGPVGAKVLTTYKWIAYGNGQIRN